jgi:Cytochrome P460
MRTKAIVCGSMALLFAAAFAAAYAQMPTPGTAGAPTAKGVVDAEGNLRVPADYRTAYEFLGIWALANKKDKGSKELHIVFASPGTIAAYQKEGHFADGSVLVKEVYETATDEMTTGIVSRPQKLTGWFVMVREGMNSHPGNNLWGNGWGWSWFDQDNPLKTTTTDFATACQPCHVPAQDTEWVYVNGYPALKKR